MGEVHDNRLLCLARNLAVVFAAKRARTAILLLALFLSIDVHADILVEEWISILSRKFVVGDAILDSGLQLIRRCSVASGCRMALQGDPSVVLQSLVSGLQFWIDSPRIIVTGR